MGQISTQQEEVLGVHVPNTRAEGGVGSAWGMQEVVLAGGVGSACKYCNACMYLL